MNFIWAHYVSYKIYVRRNIKLNVKVPALQQQNFINKNQINGWSFR